jgi:hypothetical protein
MDRTIYNIISRLDGSNGLSTLPAKVFNTSTITLNLSFAYDTTKVDIVKTKVLFEDRTYEYEFSYPSTISLYRENELTYSSQKYYAQIKIYFSNFNTYEYLIPIWFIKPTALDDFDGANIINAQFIDSEANGDMLLVMKNNVDQIFNFKMGTNQIFDSVYSSLPESSALQKIIAANNWTRPLSNITTTNDEFLVIKNK